jgi:uncharacterized membrane protein
MDMKSSLSDNKIIKLSKAGLLVLLAMGILLSGYLWYVHLMGSDVVCSTSCSEVLHGEYGVMFGVPVGALGFMFYFVMTLLFVILFETKSLFVNNIVKLGLIFGAIFTIYLRYLEFFVIGGICSWCWGSVVILTLIIILFLWGINPKLFVSGKDQ